MRLFDVAVLLSSLIGPALAQLPSGTPACAIPCFVEGVAISTCGTNVTCLCSDTAFATNLMGCVETGCTVEDALVLKNVTSTTCGRPVMNVVAEYTVISDTLTGLVIAFVAVRVIYKRFLTSLGLGADDWVMVVVALVCVPCTVLNERLADFGIGRDIWTLTPSQITDFGITLWLITLFYYAEIALLKASVLLFYLRIFPSATFRRVTWATLVFVALYGVAFVLTQMFQCWPISDNWEQWKLKDRSQAHCVDTIAIAKSNGALSIALDVWMLCLPLYAVRRLNVSLHKKLAIAAMFAAGTFVTVVSVVRFIYLVQFQNSDNLTFDYTTALVWSTVEIATGAICACMPTVRLMLIRLWPRLFASSESRHVRYTADPKPRPQHGAELNQLQSLPGSSGTLPRITVDTTITIMRENGNDDTVTPASYMTNKSHAWKNRFYQKSENSSRSELERINPSDADDGGAEEQSSRRTSEMGGQGSAASIVSSGENMGAQVVHAGPLGGDIV